ncbi:hypothetical protein FIBSPDRAFT_492598 [Athelia psychrophila]|uniref:Uncharacterized protein n=1 Tax=Athelia psychrophila TaxID=1759441 RepID=A0A166KPJ2_9AGAM|nr:hypothetical protein FIBSPDRAFT_492598 [Fibularhizoctonia sp. CBS 109695]
MRQTDYDRYYKSLPATTSTNGTFATLVLLGGDDCGGLDDDVVERFNTLNDYRKRSRSRDDVNTSTLKSTKLHESGFDAAKTNANGQTTLHLRSLRKKHPPSLPQFLVCLYHFDTQCHVHSESTPLFDGQ